MERYSGEVPATSGAAGQGGKASSSDSSSDGVAARAQRNITGWLSDGEGRSRVAKGFVAPHWRQLERTLQQTFKPPPELVRREHRTVQMARQIWTAYSRVSKPPQANEPPDREYLLGMPEGANYRAQPQAQIAAVQEAWEGPTYWRRIEIELTMESDGRVTSTRVMRSSGKLGLDDLAVEAVRKTAAEGGPLDEPGPVTTLWAVETTVVVTPPDRAGFSFDESGTLNPGAKGIRRYIGNGKYPMQEQVRTRVSLLAHHGAGGRPSGSP